MFGPEYYYDVFETENKSTGETKLQSGRFRDVMNTTVSCLHLALFVISKSVNSPVGKIMHAAAKSFICCLDSLEFCFGNLVHFFALSQYFNNDSV